jgi:hypothetical protein
MISRHAKRVTSGFLAIVGGFISFLGLSGWESQMCSCPSGILCSCALPSWTSLEIWGGFALVVIGIAGLIHYEPHSVQGQEVMSNLTPPPTELRLVNWSQ